MAKFFELYYGESGTGKSEAEAAVMKAIYNETGQVSRVMIGDGSAATYEPLVEAGICEVLDYTTRDWPLTTITQLCQGFWPADVHDPKSPMVAMTPEVYRSIGVYGIEGLTVIGNYITGDKKGGLSEQASRGVKVGGDNPVKVVDIEFDSAGNPVKGSGPGTAFGGITLGGFGIAQKRILGFLEHAKGLPGWVIWTAHQRTAEDKVTGQKIVGPEAVGGALTAGLSKHFNNTLHFVTAEKLLKVTDDHTQKSVDTVDAEYRIYTRDHFRPEGNSFVKYKAVCRTPLPNGWKDPSGKVIGTMPQFFESSTPGEAILQFYTNVKAARVQSMSGIKKPVAPAPVAEVPAELPKAA